MNLNHFALMHKARDVESQSAHPTHKVGAVLCGKDSDGHDYCVARANFWPKLLKNHIGQDEKLGNASTTVHAEIAAIIDALATEGATLYITDLPCPNCAKVIAEARVKHVYIDSHTHETPLGKKIRPYFDDISSLILKSAGIDVFEIDLEKKKIVPIVKAPANTLLQVQRPIKQVMVNSENINTAYFHSLIGVQKGEKPFAACFAKSSLGHYNFLLAESQRSVGLTEDDDNFICTTQNKYRPNLQPVNRLLLTCARYGLHVDPAYLYSAQVPTSREFVNMIGAGYSSLEIGDITKCRDEWGLKALKQLQDHGIFEIKS